MKWGIKGENKGEKKRFEEREKDRGVRRVMKGAVWKIDHLQKG